MIAKVIDIELWRTASEQLRSDDFISTDAPIDSGRIFEIGIQLGLPANTFERERKMLYLTTNTRPVRYCTFPDIDTQIT